MTSPGQAKIYLSKQRGCSQTDWHRSYHTLNFGSYFSEHTKAFNNIRTLNDDTLKESYAVKHRAQDDILVLLVPLVGALEYKNPLGTKDSLDVGQSLIFPVLKGAEFEIANPYNNELINYLHLEFTTDKKQNSTGTVVEFDLKAHENKLIPFFAHEQENNPWHASIHIGKFNGRTEATHTLKHPAQGIFVFIVEGAFEVQNRLLQPRDGLALWNIAEIEFEALSNDAIILLVE
jgi:hypothetical protein